MPDTYNGWKNYETWNVGLWLANDESLYAIARRYSKKPYPTLVRYLRNQGVHATPDGVNYADPRVYVPDMEAFLAELGEVR